MEIEFDARKAAQNISKHGVSFAHAEQLFHDPAAITIEDLDAVGERRMISIGSDALGRVLIVVFPQRDERIRLISARKASAGERRTYDAQEL